MRYLPVLLLITLLLNMLPPTRAQATLAIVGSSTSACSGATSVDSCYIGRLRAYFNTTAPTDTTIDNGYAVPGYTVYRGMPTSYTTSPYADLQPDPFHNITAALAVHPDVVLVNYPTNGFDSLRIDSVMFCLRTIRDSSIKAGVPCFVTTTQPRTSAPLFNNGPAKLKLAVLKDSILEEFGYFAIDFYTGLFNPADSSILYDAGDQTHMNNTGHDSLFQRVVAKNIFLATLPATFLQFNTVYKNNADIVTWLTSRETEVDYYEIDRSSDGIGFSKLATVAANNTAGNNQYQYTDANALKGSNYYKILIVDKDGKKHASPVMRVYINTGRLTLMKAFARSGSQVVVDLQNNESINAELQILNNMGTLISRKWIQVEAGHTSIFLDTPLMANGVYRIKITTARESIVGSFIKTQ